MRTLALIALVAAASAGDSRRSLRSREQQQFLVPRAATSPAPPAPTDLTTTFKYMSGVISQTGNKGTELLGTVAGKLVEGVNSLPAAVWSTFADSFKQFMDEYGHLPKSINAGEQQLQLNMIFAPSLRTAQNKPSLLLSLASTTSLPPVLTPLQRFWLSRWTATPSWRAPTRPPARR